MGKRMALFFMALGCAAMAHAQTTSSIRALAKDYRRIPNFDELMRMNDEQRAIVIGAVRDAMRDAVQAESMAGTRYVSSLAHTESPATAWFSLLVEAAHSEPAIGYCPRLGYILQKTSDGKCPAAPSCGTKARCNWVFYGPGVCVDKGAEDKMEAACVVAAKPPDDTARALAREARKNPRDTRAAWSSFQTHYDLMCKEPSYSASCTQMQGRIGEMRTLLDNAAWTKAPTSGSVASLNDRNAADGLVPGRARTGATSHGETDASAPGTQPASTGAAQSQIRSQSRSQSRSQRRGAPTDPVDPSEDVLPPSRADKYGCDRQALIADMSFWGSAYKPDDSVLPFRMAMALMCERGPIDEAFIAKRAAQLEATRVSALSTERTQSVHKQKWLEVISKSFRACVSEARRFRAEGVPPPPTTATLSISSEVATLRVGENSVITSLNQVGGSMAMLKVNDICSIKIDKAPLREVALPPAPARAAALGTGGSTPAHAPVARGTRRAADPPPASADAEGTGTIDIGAAVLAHQYAECVRKFPGAIPLNNGNFCRQGSPEATAAPGVAPATGTR